MTEAELLFSQILDCDRLSLYLNKDMILAQDKSIQVSSTLKRRMCLEPIQYILGKTEFMGLEFKVTPDVLIPRPETEILVETAINIVHSSKFIVHSILDIGTGSGCIAISLAKFLPKAKITAIDISEKALEIAKQNAQLNSVEINFLLSNLFSNYKLQTMNYELIICNPPYVPSEEIDRLQAELQYEPRIALDGGKDGLDFYQRIIKQAPDYLKKHGFLIMEMGFQQREKIEEILKNSANFKIIEIIKDYNGIDRVIVAQGN